MAAELSALIEEIGDAIAHARAEGHSHVHLPLPTVAKAVALIMGIEMEDEPEAPEGDVPETPVVDETTTQPEATGGGGGIDETPQINNELGGGFSTDY